MRLDDIEARLVALERAVDTMPALRFHGSWRDGQAYPAGSVVQARGCLFIAAQDAPPGVLPGDPDRDDDDRGCWRLCVRRGRPGKDAPDLERRVRALEQTR